LKYNFIFNSYHMPPKKDLKKKDLV